MHSVSTKHYALIWIVLVEEQLRKSDLNVVISTLQYVQWYNVLKFNVEIKVSDSVCFQPQEQFEK